LSTVPGRRRRVDADPRAVRTRPAIERVAAMSPRLARSRRARPSTRTGIRRPRATFSTAAWRLPLSGTGSASCTRNTGPRRFTSSDLAHASGVLLPVRPGARRVRGRCSRRTSIAPNASTVRPTRSRSASRSPTWQGTPIHVAALPAQMLDGLPRTAAALRLVTHPLSHRPQHNPSASARAPNSRRVAPVTITTAAGHVETAIGARRHSLDRVSHARVGRRRSRRRRSGRRRSGFRSASAVRGSGRSDR